MSNYIKVRQSDYNAICGLTYDLFNGNIISKVQII